jgi:hypothetical protein
MEPTTFRYERRCYGRVYGVRRGVDIYWRVKILEEREDLLPVSCAVAELRCGSPVTKKVAVWHLACSALDWTYQLVHHTLVFKFLKSLVLHIVSWRTAFG